MLQRTLLSRPNLEKLISKTDLDLHDRRTRRPGAAGAELGTDIKVTPQTRNLFTITYRNSSPKLAYDVVQTILTIFIESKTGNNRVGHAERAAVPRSSRSPSLRAAARDAEKRRAEFQAKYIDLLPSDANGDRGWKPRRARCGRCRAACRTRWPSATC